MDLEECCQGLESAKATDRAKCIKQISFLLQTPNRLEQIKNGTTCSWNHIIFSAYVCLMKDADKYVDDMKKKNTSSIVKDINGKTFFDIITLAIKEAVEIDFSKLFSYVISFLQRKTMKELYSRSCMITLRDNILRSDRFRSNVEPSDWTRLFTVLKEQRENPGSPKDDDFVDVECLSLLIKWGPLYSFSPDVLKTQFAFVTEICKSVTQSSHRTRKEIILRLAVEFCSHTAKNNRMACCKLGEDLFPYFTELYEMNIREDKLKLQLLQFFLLQVVLHHPKGVPQDHPASCAHDWGTWIPHLRSMYKQTCDEININMKCRTKNAILFCANENSRQELTHTFLNLIVEVAKQVLNKAYANVTLASASTSAIPNSKRLKLEISIRTLISDIEEMKSWPLTQVMYSLLKVYPETITKDEYMLLLKCMETLQRSCPDQDLRFHVYKCLTVLKELEMSLTVFRSCDTSHIWKAIAETTFKEAGLHLCTPVTERLLQLLLSENDSFFVQPVLKVFRTSSSVTKSRIDSLYLFGQKYGFPKFENNIVRRELMEQVLNSNNLKDIIYYNHDLTAKLLTNMVLRYWPTQKDSTQHDATSLTRPHNDIADIYFKTCFEDVLSIEQNPCNSHQDLQIPLVDTDIKQFLLGCLQQLVNNVSQNHSNDLDVLLNTMILLKNITCEFTAYVIIDDDHASFQTLLQSLIECLRKTFLTSSTSSDELILKKITKSLELFDQFLIKTNHPSTLAQIIALVPEDFMKRLFDILDKYANKKYNSLNNIKFQFTLQVMKVISSYCFISGHNGFTQSQCYAFEAIIDFKFYIRQEYDYALAYAFLSKFNLCKPGALNEASFKALLEFVKNILNARHSLYETALDMLGVIKTVLIYLEKSYSATAMNYAVSFLEILYTRRNRYGPEVSVLIVECFSLVCQIDSKFGSYKYCLSDNSITTKMCELLSSDYQEVRFASAKSIANFFSFDDATAGSIQKAMLKKIFDLSLQIFDIQQPVSKEQEIDETITRSASVLQTFASIALCSSVWFPESLFCMLRITHMKKLNGIEPVISLLVKHLGIEDKIQLLEPNLEYVIKRWDHYKCSINTFPFHLLNCSNKEEFYVKYLHIVIRLLINKENSLELLSAVVKKDKKLFVQECTAKIFADCIAVVGVSNLGEITVNNETVAKLIDILGMASFKEIIKNYINVFIYELLQYISDDAHFEQHFSVPGRFPVFYDNSFTVHEFEVCLKYLETDIFQVGNLLEYLMQHGSYSIHKLILALKLEMGKTRICKSKVFHSYFIIISLITKQLDKRFTFHEYFIRDTVMFLLNLMEDNLTNKTLSFLASRALNTFISGILPSFSNNLCPSFHIIVNKLNNIAIYSEEMINTCIDILKVLVIDNSDPFSSNIKTLDPFPCKSEFKPLRTLHLRIRHENQDVTLQKDIEYFLKCGYETKFSDLREEGLKHLLQQLTNKKQELGNIYADFKDTERKILHELIIMLVKLTKSKNFNVSIEASRCLGELGVIDLNTLVLEPDKITETQNLSPLERLTGTIISHLQLYSIDKNVQLVSSATDGLYHILNSKEGRKVAKFNEEFIRGKITLNYLTPFVTSGKPRTDSQIGFDESLLRILNEPDIWCPTDTVSHKDWITTLVCCILKTFSARCFLPKLVYVCEHSVEFCENILPYLLYTVLMLSKKQINEAIFEKIKYFFEQHWQHSLNSDEIGTLIVLNRLSLKCMLKSIHYIRLQTINASNVKSTKNCINLNLNYLHLAQAAKYSQQHFTAILYTELWCHYKYHEIADSFSQEQQKKYARSKMLDVVYENVEPQVGKVLEDILRGSYKILGEFDALHGCGTSLFLDPSRRVEHYKDLGLWDQALLYHEVALSSNTSNVIARKELVNSLKHCSLYTIPLLSKDTEIDYECLWRLRQWDVEDHVSNNKSIAKDDFERQRYMALKFLHDHDLSNLRTVINEARIDEIGKIKHVNLENCRNIYAMLTKLQSLRELENFAEMSASDKTDLLIRAWELQNKLMNTDFEYVEPIKQQRIIMLRTRPTTHEQAGFLVTTSLNLSENARHENRLNVALRTLNNLRFCDNVAENFPQQIKFEDAQLCWALNDKTSAHHILRHLYNDQETESRIRSHALKLAGKWFIESLSENKHVIMGTYLLPSLNIYKDLDRNSEDIRNIYDTYDVLGRFTDNEYQQIKNYMNSEGFQQKIKNMEKLKEAATNLRDTQGRRRLTPDENRALRIHEQQSAIDACEIENAKKERNLFLKLAMKYYLLNLANSDQNNNGIFRVVSLFLDNRFDPSITETINKYLPQIPTYKYITILPQLVPHLSNGNDDLFVEHTNEIVRKCIQDHPYHTLPLILSLVYSNKDREFSETTTNTSTSDSRIETARNLLKKIKQTNRNLNDVIVKMEFLSEALIQLAYYKPPPGREKDKKCNIPVSLKLPKVKNYTNVLLPTCNLEVSKTCSYDNLVGIQSFGEAYSNVGGINAPKRITCRGTDGQLRTQLLKGHDDLRQDAVMQQVFTIMNSLLSTNKTTKNLRIRTYKIVPLSMRSGILEWVENSIPIGTYLAGDSDGTVGAHLMYRPNDKRPKECRLLVSRTAKSLLEEKLSVYNDVCNHIKPVFHKFFEYSFPQPSEWYEHHRAYIYSVATSSMCGYILGIGDRHVQNILIDKGTAEVIHIDFGIAFEQGRCLPTPETVPFRLTRDIIDGMGVCGVDGVFRKSCERTMEVMRLNSQTILTIVEVLLYDPLYTWTVTPAEANKRQKGQDQGESTSSDFTDGTATAENVSTNITAERALMRLKSKLHGTEDGYPVSLEHQVGTLIQQAQDPANLCRLFSGWQAYL